MTTNVYKNMIYRKIIKDILLVMLRGTQMVNGCCHQNKIS